MRRRVKKTRRRPEGAIPPGVFLQREGGWETDAGNCWKRRNTPSNFVQYYMDMPAAYQSARKESTTKNNILRLYKLIHTKYRYPSGAQCAGEIIEHVFYILKNGDFWEIRLDLKRKNTKLFLAIYITAWYTKTVRWGKVGNSREASHKDPP